MVVRPDLTKYSGRNPTYTAIRPDKFHHRTSPETLKVTDRVLRMAANDVDSEVGGSVELADGAGVLVS